jgi:site-specific DNA recombinase
MKDHTTRRSLRSAIYTRVSTDQGLEQDFNSLDAQREACQAYIKSQSPPHSEPAPSSPRSRSRFGFNLLALRQVVD